MLFISLAAVVSGCSNPGPTERAESEQATDDLEGYRLETDAAFLNAYAEYLRTSITMADLAVRRAVRPEVRALARTVMADHRELYEELTALSQQERIPLQAELTRQEVEAIQAMENVDPAAFDEAYLKKVIKEHQWIKEESEAIVEKTKLDSIIDFIAKVRSQNFIHYNQAKEMLEEVT